DRNKEHSIEIVVDELIIDKSLDQERLKDSLDIGLRIGKGVVIIIEKKRESVFSIHFACEKCGFSLPELEPRLFSFNNPSGACPDCTGLGEKLEIDPALIIPNLNLTLNEGAIIPWMRSFNKIGKESVAHKEIADLSKRHNFSLNEPLGNLQPEVIDKILYGDSKFSGVIATLEGKYHKTESDWTRKEIEQYMVIKKCPTCQGKRLRPEILAVKVEGQSIDQLTNLSIDKLNRFFKDFKDLSEVSEPIIKEIINRTQLLMEIGLDYLTLNRKTGTLSGGEEQRVKLSIQIGSKLTGVLYVLDEPSIGLHPKDQMKLINTLKKLRDFGNTVVVVEHDMQTIRECDWIIDVGPGAGKYGGEIIFEGNLKKLKKANTLTAKYLSGKLKIQSLNFKSNPKSKAQNFLTIKGAEENNLKNIDVKIPLNKFVCVTGVSGSGKSSLVDDILAKALLQKFYRAKEEPGKHKEILGIESLNKVVLVDQSPIGRTPRSNPATYTGVFSYIRELFTKTKEAEARNYTSSLFSFNVKGGRCEACEGQGQEKIEMYFMPDIYIECKECQGKRYNDEILEINYKGKNISEVLGMTIEEALEFFKEVPGISPKLKTLKEVGLSYIQLGQPAPSLSGGEAQRVKLATELSRKSSGKTLYILDEPTTGLHLDDINKLIKVLRELVNKGNTVVSIEHNTDFINCTDWVIDLGPDGGDKGGEIIAEGTPSEIKRSKTSHTAKYL
ncbi:excinuclease ABC subunit UvrA, partial [Patescibacteria group bacterium]|nr:excinuclease ABC subunit UvrA [Patescibacteria group bacterium]